MTILLVDDNPPSRELMRELLEAFGHLIVEAVNGRDALDLIRENQLDLVFLDLQMPFWTVSVSFENCETMPAFTVWP